MDPHDLVGSVLISTNQKECVEKCMLECVLLTFFDSSLSETNR